MRKFYYTQLQKELNSRFRKIEIAQPNDIIVIDNDILIDTYNVEIMNYPISDFERIQYEQYMKMELSKFEKQYGMNSYTEFIKKIRTHAKNIKCEVDIVLDENGKQTIQFKKIEVSLKDLLKEKEIEMYNAVDDERYEDAAILRDEIADLKQKLNIQ